MPFSWTIEILQKTSNNYISPTESYTLNFKKSKKHFHQSHDNYIEVCQDVRKVANPAHRHKHQQKLPVHREKQLNDLLLCDAKWHLSGAHIAVTESVYLQYTFPITGWNLFTLENSIVFRLFVSKERPKWRWPCWFMGKNNTSHAMSCNLELEITKLCTQRNMFGEKVLYSWKVTEQGKYSRPKVHWSRPIFLRIWVLVLVSFLSLSLLQAWQSILSLGHLRFKVRRNKSKASCHCAPLAQAYRAACKSGAEGWQWQSQKLFLLCQPSAPLRRLGLHCTSPNSELHCLWAISMQFAILHCAHEHWVVCHWLDLSHAVASVSCVKSFASIPLLWRSTFECEANSHEFPWPKVFRILLYEMILARRALCRSFISCSASCHSAELNKLLQVEKPFQDLPFLLKATPFLWTSSASCHCSS